QRPSRIRPKYARRNSADYAHLRRPHGAHLPVLFLYKSCVRTRVLLHKSNNVGERAEGTKNKPTDKPKPKRDTIVQPCRSSRPAPLAALPGVCGGTADAKPVPFNPELGRARGRYAPQRPGKLTTIYIAHTRRRKRGATCSAVSGRGSPKKWAITCCLMTRRHLVSLPPMQQQQQQQQQAHEPPPGYSQRPRHPFSNRRRSDSTTGTVEAAVAPLPPRALSEGILLQVR
ncbi:unnamed protein product, partial [Ectocarpus fasciculatus]